MGDNVWVSGWMALCAAACIGPRQRHRDAPGRAVLARVLGRRCGHPGQRCCRAGASPALRHRIRQTLRDLDQRDGAGRLKLQPGGACVILCESGESGGGFGVPRVLGQRLPSWGSAKRARLHQLRTERSVRSYATCMALTSCHFLACPREDALATRHSPQLTF